MEEIAAFEHGYRDGLHNELYDSRRSSAACGSDDDVGHEERATEKTFAVTVTDEIMRPSRASTSQGTSAAAERPTSAIDLCNGCTPTRCTIAQLSVAASEKGACRA